MHSKPFVLFRPGLFVTTALAWFAPIASAQMVIYPGWLSTYGFPAAHQAMPEPAPGESSACLALPLEHRTVPAVELQVAALIGQPELSNSKADPFAAEFTGFGVCFRPVCLASAFRPAD